MKHNIFPVFSFPIFATKLSLKIDELDKFIIKLNQEKLIKINLEESSGLTSEDKYILNKPQYFDLKNQIMNALLFYNQEYLKYKTSFKMTTSWIAKTLNNTSSALHNHTNSFLSGVLYLQAEKNCGDIVFENMNICGIQIDVEEDTIYNTNKFQFVPSSGVLIFFPSRMYHKILNNNSNKERLSIAFNFMPDGETGYEDSKFTY